MSALHISPDGPWSLGVKVGLPFAILGVLAAVAVAVLLTFIAVTYEPQDSYSFFRNRLGPSVIAATVWIVVVGGFVTGILFAYYPYDGAYHQWRRVDGTVQQISSRFVGSDHSTTQKFVVTFAGSPQQFAVDDTRAALVHPGDHITISCKKSFQYGATDGYDCNWGTP